MKELFNVVARDGRILSVHESKKEAKKERDKHNKMDNDFAHVSLGKDHFRKQETQKWR